MADQSRLLLDAMLGKLTTYLRMCGYDAAYALDRSVDSEGHCPPDSASEPHRDPRVEADDALLALARAEDRRLVTRDAELASRADDALLLETTAVTDQLRELAAAGFDLSLTEPSRCARCNAALERVSEDERTPEYAPAPAETAVWRCRSCEHHFWKGSHWDDVDETLESL